MTIWFTADEHYGHENIIKYCIRPFANATHMNEELIYRHNSVVSYSDEVWHLGDFSMREDVVPRILPRLNGRHHLIVGNHDRVEGFDRYLSYGFRSVALTDELDDFVLNHHPYPDGVPSICKWLLCGHVHEKWKVKRNMINVGVDQWCFYPVPLYELIKLKWETTAARLQTEINDYQDRELTRALCCMRNEKAAELWKALAKRLWGER